MPRKRPSDHLELEHTAKKPKRSACHKPDIHLTNSECQYRYCSILPDVKELHIKHKILPHVKPNIEQGNYDSCSHYLSTQFNLLREDFVAPLRRAVLEYENGVDMSTNAKFAGIVLQEEGVLLTVELTEGVSISKSFINGTLLCFSSDNFATILFATVVSQREENQTEEVSKLNRYSANQVMQVKVESSDVNNLDILGINGSGCISNSQTYMVIKSPAHYETYYNVLKCLQRINPHHLPFENYLIAYRHKMRRPRYLHVTGRERNVHFNMAEVLKLRGNSRHRCFDITNKDGWSNYDFEGLDESQVKALQVALTSEVALIQGPPGTGKTYIGSKIMEALLINKDKWDPDGNSPILVVSYTNQALDQFFEKVINIKSKQANSRLYYHGGLDTKLKCNPREIVRIGGGCNDAVSCYSLKNLRSVDSTREINKKAKPITVTNNKHDKFLYAQESKFKKLQKKINRSRELFLKSLLTIEDLSEHIDPAHLHQLKSMHKRAGKCIGVWLQGKNHEMTKTIFPSRQPTKYLPNSTFSKSSGMHYNSCNVMEYQTISYTKSKVQSIDDIRSLSINERKALFSFWITQFRHHQYNEICTLIEQFNEIHRIFIDSRDRRHLQMLQKAHVIGMTTSGAAKYKHLLEQLKPKIVIAEEAAEVLESHIVACLTTATEHLILIGDHQQLQPNPKEYMLTRDYKLGISLFERLKNNGVPCAQLQIQHRMRPEIADLVRTHVYTNLELKDHSCVKNYGNIKGITTNMYFFDHKYPETYDEENKSYCNEEEGNFVIRLCYYLLKHYEYNEITVLTAYSSQVKLLQKQIQDLDKKRNFNSGRLETSCNTANEERVEVKTIDNYQGEENRIIILSLVRSNENEDIGFLKTKNRNCVALSRAKEGLYCFGNFTTLSKKSQLWKYIYSDLQKKQKIGSVLKLCCVNHQSSITDITRPRDFDKVPHGGCGRQCNEYLNCGHRCMLKCHVTDQDHKNYRCKETCQRKCKNCGEPCNHECYILCSSQKCEALVVKTIPKCNHSQLVPCHMELEKFKCQEKCGKTCSHGHPCNLKCYEECKPCKRNKTNTLSCGHKVTLYCFQNYAVPECTAPCNKICTTNTQSPHRCAKRCSDVCGNCETMVKVTLPWCGHRQQVPCYMQHSLRSFADIISCTEMITKLPTCGHIAVMPCGEDTFNYSCCAPVTITLPCGHNKEIECYKTQGANREDILALQKCSKKVKKSFYKCKHLVYLPCHKSHLTECPDKCNTVLLCGHKCSGTCHECHQGRLHKPCMFHISKLLCGHETTMACSSTMIEPYPSCSYRCERFCSHKKCSHKCQEPCKPCHKPCDWQCPHYKCTRRCNERCNRPRCYEPCPRLNKCHHPCIGVCGERCPDVCKICDEERFLQLYVSLNRFKTKDDTTYIQLDCGHLFKRTELDPWVDACSRELQLISCPKCNQIIHLNQRRYANAVIRTYDNITDIHHTINEDVEVNVKVEVLTRYLKTLESVMKVSNLTYLKTLTFGLTITYEELKKFQISRQLPVLRDNNTLSQEIEKFIQKKKNWLSAVNIIINIFNSILSLLKVSEEHSDIANYLKVLLEFVLVNHRLLSIQIIQDVTSEQRRLALWIMTKQLQRELLDHADLQTVKREENILITKPGEFHKPLLSQHATRIYSRLSKLANKYELRLLDKNYMSTPNLPLLYTGRWTQCIEGHFYCIPQQLAGVTCDFSTNQECPHCSENDDEIDDMDVVTASQ